jgi:hypothetical protein
MTSFLDMISLVHGAFTAFGKDGLYVYLAGMPRMCAIHLKCCCPAAVPLEHERRSPDMEVAPN